MVSTNRFHLMFFTILKLFLNFLRCIINLYLTENRKQYFANITNVLKKHKFIEKINSVTKPDFETNKSAFTIISTQGCM